MQHIPQIFDRKRVRLHRSRAGSDFAGHDFLFREAAERLSERLDDVARDFPLVLDLGAKTGFFHGHPKIGALVESEFSTLQSSATMRVIADEENLPFAPEIFDLVMSSLSLHWVNDLPGALIQIRQCLKPDGLFLAQFFGGQTLKELRDALATAALEIEGGLTPHISPFIDVRDAGSLLGRAGFSLPVVDSETVTVSYEHAFALMKDLRGMGESNALTQMRKNFSLRRLFTRAAEIYQERYAGADGRIPATFELVTLTAWAPHETQQKPAKRGSGKVNLKDFLKDG